MLATLNLQLDAATHGPWPVRRTRVAAAIAAAAPTSWLSRRFAATLRGGGPRGRWVERRITVPLSLRPSRHLESFSLPADPSGEDPFQRVALHGRFSFEPPLELHLFNAHVSWVGGTATAQLAELAEVAGSIEGTWWCSGI